MNLRKKFLIMDVTRCIDCDNCVLACKRRHGIARFQRQGFQIGTIRVPTSCKNCEDPECISSCKVEGMTRLNHRFTQPTETCIGCGLCSKNCPFGAIQMFKSNTVPVTIEYLKIDEKVKKIKLPKKKTERKREVWKCDGCIGYKNKGCVYNCPTGALQEVVLIDFIKTIPYPWAVALVNYLSPAFLTKEEKEKIRTGQVRLIVDQNYNINLEPIFQKELVQAVG